MKILCALFFFAAACISCKRSPETLFELLSPDETGIYFENTIIESDSFNVLKFTNIYNGGGVTVADFNNDGFNDLFLSGNMVSSELYINKGTSGEIEFRNITNESGVSTDLWINGVTAVDINQDGWMDIYACVSGSSKPNKRANLLFINQGLNKNKVPVFKEMASAYNLNDTSYTTQAAFFDYDKDGDLDVYMIVNKAENYYRGTVNVPGAGVDIDKSKSDRLYRNNLVECGSGQFCHEKFTDISTSANITKEGYSLGITVTDINNDSWPDIYISNDFLSNDILYINNQDGTFSDKSAQYFKHTSFAGMGSDVADFNNDGLPDIVEVDMTPAGNSRQKSMLGMTDYQYFQRQLQNGYYPQFSRNTLQLNRGLTPDSTLLFSEIGRMAGIHYTDWSWSVLMADYNLDGFKDIFITNGFRRDLQDLDFINVTTRPQYSSNSNKNEEAFLQMAHNLPGINEANYIFKNNGNYSFSDESETWLGKRPSYSHGAAFADLDNDGDLDLVVNNINQVAFVHENRTNTIDHIACNYIKIRLNGREPNIDAIGARVIVFTGDQYQMLECQPTRGFQSSVDKTLTFGLDSAHMIDSITVIWPDGKVTKEFKVSVNQLHNIVYNESSPKSIEQSQIQETLLSNVNVKWGIDYKHEEHDFNDFQYQTLIPKKHSQNGPGIAVGDINGDDLDDFIVGSSRFSVPQFFIQGQDGAFTQGALKSNPKYEELGILLFDADNDADNDLYLVGGSVENGYAGDYYQDRLFVNDGAGNFSLAADAIPESALSGNAVKAADYDKDGDLDLFIGNRILPGRYPLPVSSYVLENKTTNSDKPVFETSQAHHILDSLGMVTDALWTDVDNDGWIDLFVVGEWMPLTIIKNNQGHLNEKIELEHTRGWWNSVLGGDFDNDGDTDYIIGNVGQNQIYKPDVEQPVRIYANDFDKNGSLDPIFAYYINGKNVPAHPRDELLEQIPSLKNVFPTYQSYAKVTMDDLLAGFDTNGTTIVEAELFSSVLLENTGKGGFELHELPAIAQFAPIYGMQKTDINFDGNLDLILTGNTYNVNLQTGFYDASTGLVLKGKGDNTFEPLTLQESGFVVDSDAKAFVSLNHVSGVPLLISSSNDDELKAFQLKENQGKFIHVKPNDVYAIISFINGQQRKEECYYGSAYLSQASRSILITPNMNKIEVYNVFGESRELNLLKYRGLSAR